MTNRKYTVERKFSSVGEWLDSRGGRTPKDVVDEKGRKHVLMGDGNGGLVKVRVPDVGK